MQEFSLVLDCFNIKELDSYLKTIDGVKKVSIDDDYLVTINVKYDSKIINMEFDSSMKETLRGKISYKYED